MPMNRGFVALSCVFAILTTNAFAAPPLLELSKKDDGFLLWYALNRADLNFSAARGGRENYPDFFAQWFNLMSPSEKARFNSATNDLPPHKLKKFYEAEFDKAIAPVSAALKSGFCYHSSFNTVALNGAREGKYEFEASLARYITSKGENPDLGSMDPAPFYQIFTMPESKLSNELYKKLMALDGGKGMYRVCLNVTGKKGEQILGNVISASIINIKDMQTIYEFPPNSRSMRQ